MKHRQTLENHPFVTFKVPTISKFRMLFIKLFGIKGESIDISDGYEMQVIWYRYKGEVFISAAKWKPVPVNHMKDKFNSKLEGVWDTRNQE